MKELLKFLIENWGEISALILAFFLRLIEKRKDRLKIASDLEKMMAEKNGLIVKSDFFQFINKLKGRSK